MNVRGVILAAGMGRRMGVVKQTLPFLGKPLLQHVIDAARFSRMTHLSIILGHAHAEILADIEPHSAEIHINPNFDRGQSTSVHTGLTSGPDTEGIMFLLGDQPLVTTHLIDALIDLFSAERPLAVMPTYHGTPGNPVILGRQCLPLLADVSGDYGARRILHEHAERVRRLEVSDPMLLRDIDTMEEYQRLLADCPATLQQSEGRYENNRS